VDRERRDPGSHTTTRALTTTRFPHDGGNCIG
jgi:hypothetical protein